MIHVNRHPEPPDFDAQVRCPGAKFLAACPNPSSKDWKKNSYWKNARDDLYNAYNGVCAYTGEWFPTTIGVASIDHFLPKSRAPQLAFEWGNYRLTTQKTNSNKSDYIIVDPFEVQLGWFTLDIPSCLIIAGDDLACGISSQVEFTIEKLKLNSSDEYVERRYETILEYVSGDISFQFLQRRFPFIASELERQGLSRQDELGKRFRGLK